MDVYQRDSDVWRRIALTDGSNGGLFGFTNAALTNDFGQILARAGSMSSLQLALSAAYIF